MRIRTWVGFCALGIALAANVSSAGPMLLDNVPAYNWYHGCGPTAAASITGYWDLAGLSNLFDASGADVNLTDNVKDQISSPAHNAKYDPDPDIADSLLPVPPKTSLADWFETSVNQAMGWSYEAKAAPTFVGYFSYRGYAASASTVNWDDDNWTAFTTQINSGKPLLFRVDSDGDGVAEHFVPVFGYDDRGADGRWYAFYDTWSEGETVRWEPWRGLSVSGTWGIASYTTVTPSGMWRKTGAGGNWSSASNWTSNLIPSATRDSAWIDNNGAAATMDSTANLLYTYVGWRRSGTLIHTGSLTTQALRIGEYAGASGVFEYRSGTLRTGDLSIGNSGTAVMRVTGSNLRFSVANRFHLGAGGRFEAVPGSAMTMTGTAFEIAAIDPAAAGGLGNLRIDLESGIANKCSFEVAGLDLGPTLSGFQGNFAIGSLRLDGTVGGSIKLVNASANAGGGAGEALYIKELILGTDSLVELNGQSLYYLSNGVPQRLLYGDANLDGVVDQADYTAWYNGYGKAGGWLCGDFSGDGLVDQSDYTLWYNSYGASGIGNAGRESFPPLGAGYGGSAPPVPEPASLALLVIGTAALLRRGTKARPG